MKKICNNCGKEFEPKYPRNPNKVCSNKCKYEMTSKRQRVVALTNNPMWRKDVVEKALKNRKYYKGKNHQSWKGGVEINSGYKCIYAPDHPCAHKNKVKEHRLIMEKHIGRYLESNELVHHIDGDKLNNDINNLQIVTRAEHMMLHLHKDSI